MTTDAPTLSAWLARRESADARSRAPELATHAAALTRTPRVVHDLGSGTGGMMRWLAPVLGGTQTWVLHDWDAALLAEAAAAPPGGVTVRTHVADLAGLDAADLAGASLVTASALLDVLDRRQLEAIVSASMSAGVPVYVTLSVTGRVDLAPPHAADRALETAFNAHQRRAHGDGRRLLGPDAVEVAADLFRAGGWSLRTAEAPWDLGGGDRALVEEWLDGWIDAACAQDPTLTDSGAAHRARRRAQLRDGALRVRVAHRDLLAWPP